MRFLRERIRLMEMAKGDANKEAESTAQRITSALSTERADRILEQIKISTQRVNYATKDRQTQKFEKLVHEKHTAVSPADTPYVDKINWVINLSSRSLSDAEIALLWKGVNFAVTFPNIPDYHQCRISCQTTLHRASRPCQKSRQQHSSTGGTTRA